MTYEQAQQIIDQLQNIYSVLWLINGAAILIAIRTFR